MKHLLISTKTTQSFLCAILLVSLITTSHSTTASGRTFIGSDYDITSITCDNNYLWAGTYRQGLLRINKTNGESELYPVVSNSIGNSSIRTVTFNADNNLLIGTLGSGVLQLENGNWKPFPTFSDSMILGLSADNTDNIWVQTNNQGVVRSNGENWFTVVDPFQGVMARSPDSSIWLFNVPPRDAADCSSGWIRKYNADGEQLLSLSLEHICSNIGERPQFITDNDNCWIASGDTLIRISDDGITLFPVTTSSDNIKISAMTVSNDNIILFVAGNYTSKTFGVYLYDPNGDSDPLDSCIFTREFPTIDIASADEVDGGFWCATLTGEILRVDAAGAVTILPKSNAVLPENHIASLLVDNSDNVWVATPSGIARYDNSTWSIFTKRSDSLAGNDASSLALDSSGTVWAGFQQQVISSMVDAGISYFTDDQWKLLEKHYYPIRSIAIDSEGTLWACSDNGVSRYSGTEPEQLFEVPENKRYQIDEHWLNTIVFDNNNNPWIGTDEGIKRRENGSWIDDTTIDDYFLKVNDTGGVSVNAIAFSDAITWIGTGYGLLICTEHGCEEVDTSHGNLPGCNVRCITPDRATGTWIGTDGGLVNMSKLGNFTYATDNSPLFDNDITACTVTSDGDVWVGTRQGGLTLFQLDVIAVQHDSRPKQIRNNTDITVSFSPAGKRNTSVSLQTDKRAEISFLIFSLNGTIVRRINQYAAQEGTVTLHFDGTDRFNRQVSAGMYVGVVTVNGRSVERRLIGVR